MRDRASLIESVINNAPIGVYLVDQDFRIAQVNPIATPVFGLIPNLVGRDFDEVIHILWQKEYADELVGIFRHTLETGESYVAHERAELRLDRGITEYYDWRIDRIALPDRRYGVVCYFADVSLQVEARQTIAQSEAEFRKLAENLKEANRLKDEFLATLSHELRTPLNAILGWSHMLRSGALASDVHTRALDALERNAKAQARLVEELLDVSRIISGKLSIKTEPVDVAAVVADAVETMRPAAVAKGIALDLDVDPAWHLSVLGDADRLRQIAWNLISNAVRFTPADGRVAVTVRREADNVEVIVSDTGEGIEAAFFPFLFERFRQADSTPSRRHGGLGLGLAIVRHLAEAHGGTVRAESPGPGHGATFIVRLPLRGTMARESTAARELAVAPAISGARILVADDESDARELLQYLLSSHGADVTTVASAGEAVYALGRDRFDLLVADLGMPEQDGYALIRAVRSLPEAKGGTIPAIAVTAYASLREREEALAAGYDWHLAKPIETEQLVAVVATAIRGR
jgi:signal transduction histidine kinase/ActR/RegA family two-component response regulator